MDYKNCRRCIGKRWRKREYLKHTALRLRLILKDKSKANMEMLEEIEGAKNFFNSGQLQVIFEQV